MILPRQLLVIIFPPLLFSTGFFPGFGVRLVGSLTDIVQYTASCNHAAYGQNFVKLAGDLQNAPAAFQSAKSPLNTYACR